MRAELARKPVVRLAAGLLLVLHAVAVYAPFLAGDRPLVLEAVDRGAYDEARRSLAVVSGVIVERIEAGDLGPGLEGELSALALRLETMRRALPEGHREPLDELERAAGEAARAARGGHPDALAAAQRLRAGADDLRAHTDPSHVTLVASRSYPLLEALSPLEVFLQVLFALFLVRPLWSRAVDRFFLRGERERIRRARAAKAAAVLAASLAAAVLWALLAGGSAAFEVAPYKQGLSAGTIEARTAVFPPHAFGFAETHLEEALRPPTWTRASEVDAEGRPLYRPVGQEAEVELAYAPVDVRHAEPEANAWTRHPLGTDQLGRDLLARLVHGARVSLLVGLVSTALLCLLGVAVGAVAGYAGGRADLLLSRLIEIVQSIPAFFLILAAVALVPDRTLHPLLAIIAVIALVRWTGVARLVRGECLRLKEEEFVLAARAAGLSPARIVLRHVLPNALGPVLVAAAFSTAGGILTESAVSFLGFGIRAPIPSWGAMINDSRSPEHWWIQFFPGLLIFATVLAYNLVGEGLRDALDPRLSRTRGAEA